MINMGNVMIKFGFIVVVDGGMIVDVNISVIEMVILHYNVINNNHYYDVFVYFNIYFSFLNYYFHIILQ